MYGLFNVKSKWPPYPHSGSDPDQICLAHVSYHPGYLCQIWRESVVFWPRYDFLTFRPMLINRGFSGFQDFFVSRWTNRSAPKLNQFFQPSFHITVKNLESIESKLWSLGFWKTNKQTRSHFAQRATLSKKLRSNKIKTIMHYSRSDMDDELCCVIQAMSGTVSWAQTLWWPQM